MPTSVEVRVKQVIFDEVYPHDKNGPDDIESEDHLVDGYGADSLDILNMMIQLEEEFTCEVEEKVAMNWETVGDVIKYFKGCDE